MKHNLLVFILFFCSCQLNFSADSKSEHHRIISKSMSRLDSIGLCAKLINLGFDDNPVYVWVEMVNHYTSENKIFYHIYGIKHIYVNSNIVDTAYYEIDQRKIVKLIDCSFSKETQIIPYPGDATYKITFNKDTILFFNVMQSENSRQIINKKEWEIGVPTTKINQHGEKVSDGEISISIEKTSKNYLVSLIDEKGIRTLAFSCYGNCPITNKLSYLDKNTGRLFFVDKNCFLELNDKNHLSDL